MIGLFLYFFLQTGRDPLWFAHLGTRYSEAAENGTVGYDGQFVYYIARELHPDQSLPFLDIPAYRYQRILLPLLARFVSFGNLSSLPWNLIVIGMLAHTVGVWIVSELLVDWGVSRWFALVYGLWIGAIFAVLTDLPEPLAYALVLGAVLAFEKKHPIIGWILLGLAVFAKEVTLIVAAAILFSTGYARRWKDFLTGFGLSIFPFVLFQVWLFFTFGNFGIGSGGANATPFEIIPFMGLWRILFIHPLYFTVVAAIFIPSVVIPSLWSIWSTARQLQLGEKHVVVFVLLFSAIIIPFTPFSTFEDILAMTRFMVGLVMAVVLFAARFRAHKARKYALLWIPLILLIPSIGMHFHM